MAVFLAEGLHRGLVVQQSGDDISVDGGILFAHHHIVAIADSGIHHGIAVDFQHEQGAGAGQPFRQTHDVVHMLFGGNWHAGGNTANERHIV